MTDRTIVVLGWDGLDHELATEYGLSDAFGDHVRSIETYDNPALGEPHTWELWPTLVTGVGPDEHGIVHSSETEGVDWENPLVRRASAAAQEVLPNRLRADIGRRLRSAGAGVAEHGPGYYDERGLETVFDDRCARPISIPNYRTTFDEELGLSFDREALFADYVRKRADVAWQPTTSQSLLEARITADLMRRVGILRAALEREYDVVWVWFGYLDTVGHLEPALDEPLQRRAYDVAAEVTASVRAAAAPSDLVVSVADHGLRDGDHTHSPLFAADDADLVAEVESVFDVAPALDRRTPRGDDRPAVREPFQVDGGDEPDLDGVRDTLENLGYIER